MLIKEAPYLIDDKSAEMCIGKPPKEQFRIQIDSVRKSLGIDNMEDVNLLVDTLYGFNQWWEEEQQKKRDEEENQSEHHSEDG